MLFVSCFRWNAEIKEWRETGMSVNLGNVEEFHIVTLGKGDVVTAPDVRFNAEARSISGATRVILEGGESYDQVCRLLGAILNESGVLHWPPIATDTTIEHERKPGTLGHEPPGSN